MIFFKISLRSHSSVWLERGANNAKVVGSIPTGTSLLFYRNILREQNDYEKNQQ